MTSLLKTLKLLILLLISVEDSDCVNFCDVKTFDSIFNIGHLIYFLRCGQMWTFDPRLNGGEGGIIRDYSPLIAYRKYFAKDVHLKYGKYSPQLINISAFSFQELNCVDKEEDMNRRCQQSIDHWQHLTFILDGQYAIPFKYNTEYVKLIYSHQFDIHWPNIGKYWNGRKWVQSNIDYQKGILPDLSMIAQEFSVNEQKRAKIMFGLYDPINYLLFIVVKKDEYNCITYLDLRKRLFDWYLWSTTEANWVNAHCFIGIVRGMFFLENSVYIVGQVLYDNRIYDDQIYKMYANGVSKVEFQLMISNNGNSSSSEPQTVRRFFGCSPKKVNRKKRSISEPKNVRTNKDYMKTLAKRVVNNIFIEILFLTLVFILIYKIFRTRINRFLTLFKPKYY